MGKADAKPCMPQVPTVACLQGSAHVQVRPPPVSDTSASINKHTVTVLPPCLAAPELTGQGGCYISPQYQTNLWHTAKRRPLNPRWGKMQGQLYAV